MWWWCVLDTPDHLLSLSVCRVSKPQNVGNQEGEFTPGPRHHAKGADAEGAAPIYLPHSRYLLKRMSSQRVVSDVAFRPISHAGHTGGRAFPGTLRTRRAREHRSRPEDKSRFQPRRAHPAALPWQALGVLARSGSSLGNRTDPGSWGCDGQTNETTLNRHMLAEMQPAATTSPEQRRPPLKPSGHGERGWYLVKEGRGSGGQPPQARDEKGSSRVAIPRQN